MCGRKNNVFFFRCVKNQFFVSCRKISSRLCSCLCKVWMVSLFSVARLKIAGRMSIPDWEEILSVFSSCFSMDLNNFSLPKCPSSLHLVFFLLLHNESCTKTNMPLVSDIQPDLDHCWIQPHWQCIFKSTSRRRN